MPDATVEGSSPRLGLSVWATRAAFLAVGLGIAAWAPFVPLVKAWLHLDDARLGVLLLFVGVGSIVTMPFSGGLVARFGCRTVYLTSALIMGVALPVGVVSRSFALTAVALFFFGAGTGVADVTMNIQAVTVEKASGKAMMSGFHGLFSLGALIGAAVTTALLNWKVPPAWAVSGAIGMAAVALGVTYGGFLTAGRTGDDSSPALAMPRGTVLLIGLFCVVMFMVEGSVTDWSGVLLTSRKLVSLDQGGIGYVAFMATMTLGRLTGDWTTRHLGRRKGLVWGAAMAAAGFALAAVSLDWRLVVLGYGLVGIGAANTVPVLFTEAGNQESMPSHLAVAAVSTMGYAGFLAGPPIIGFVSKGVGLPTAILGLAGCVALVAVFGRAVTQPSTTS